jgi:hypothetical protein
VLLAGGQTTELVIDLNDDRLMQLIDAPRHVRDSTGRLQSTTGGPRVESSRCFPASLVLVVRLVHDARIGLGLHGAVWLRHRRRGRGSEAARSRWSFGFHGILLEGWSYIGSRRSEHQRELGYAQLPHFYTRHCSHRALSRSTPPRPSPLSGTTQRSG